MGFELFAGNEKVKETLQQMLAAGRLPHAILLEGEEGLGKTTLAKIIATGAVCAEADPPCGNCGNCHLAQVGSHPDITIIEPDGKLIKIDTVREVINSAYVKPSQAKKKVFIFKEAHRMNEAGQNALLKTLEEPPESVVFILLAESAAAMLETVVSRCTVFSLSAPETEDGIKILQQRGFDREEAKARLAATAGNIGRALAEDKGKKLKLDPEDFIKLIAENDSYSALLQLKKLEKDRAGALLFFEALNTSLLSARRAEALGMGYSGLSADYLKFMTEAVSEAAQNLAKNGNMSLIFHTLCLKLK